MREEGTDLAAPPSTAAIQDTAAQRRSFAGKSGLWTMWTRWSINHRVRSEEDYLQHFEYMRLNPYKHQLVNDEKEP